MLKTFVCAPSLITCGAFLPLANAQNQASESIATSRDLRTTAGDSGSVIAFRPVTPSDTTTSDTPAAPATPAAPRGFFTRLGHAYLADWTVDSNSLAQHCFAPDYVIANYIAHEFNHHHSALIIRNELVDDLKGQRTGSKTRYSEHLVGFNFWLGSTVAFRPELRCEHSYDVPAYDSPYLGAPTKKSQGILAGDRIYHF
jgi:hypothetical protein